jgi:lipoate-protein ligase B
VSPLGRSSRTRRAVARVDLGRAEYGSVLELQRELRDRRADGSIGDLLITVEHEPVFTIGRRGTRDNLLVTEAELAAEGIGLFEVERGGDITYHGPGQLVVYPIVDLRDYGRDLRGYVDRLEETTIRTLRAFGVEGRREPGLPGVWTERGKIASLGVHVRRWITMHGLALNVDVNRRHFTMIRPCGLPVEVVSVSDIAGETVGLTEVTDRFLNEAEIVFGWRLESVDGRDVAEG